MAETWNSKEKTRELPGKWTWVPFNADRGFHRLLKYLMFA